MDQAANAPEVAPDAIPSDPEVLQVLPPVIPPRPVEWLNSREKKAALATAELEGSNNLAPYALPHSFAKRTKLYLIVGVVAVLLAVGLGVGLGVGLKPSTPQSSAKTSVTSTTPASTTGLSLSRSSSASASTTASPPNGTIPSFPSSETPILVSQPFYNGQLVSTMTVTTTIPASIPATLTSLGVEFPAASSPTPVVDCPAVNDTLYVSNTSSTLQAFELFCSSTPTNPVINGSSDYWATLVRPIFNSMTTNSFEECINACASLNSRNPPSIGCFMVGYVQSSCSLYKTWGANNAGGSTPQSAAYLVALG